MICCTTVSVVIICVSKGWQLSIVNIDLGKGTVLQRRPVVGKWCFNNPSRCNFNSQA